MMNQPKHIFGPVASRRLGRSLGVDVVPFKVCSLDCLYCQLGRADRHQCQRADYVDIDEVLAELEDVLARPTTADYITLSGSGEPTLHSRLGELIGGIKRLSDIPVALLTNATLFDQSQVRQDAAIADVVAPSLDAGDEQTFQRINRPAPGITLERIISGLEAFGREYQGQIWLEVFILDGVNSSDEQVDKIIQAVKRIKPDKIQLNTAVRPTAYSQARRAQDQQLRQIAARFGGNCQIIAPFSDRTGEKSDKSDPECVLAMLARRPCSLADIAEGLSWSKDQAAQMVEQLESAGKIRPERKNGQVFYTIDK